MSPKIRPDFYGELQIKVAECKGRQNDLTPLYLVYSKKIDHLNGLTWSVKRLRKIIDNDNCTILYYLLNTPSAFERRGASMGLS
jgi:hypothetical protein